MASSKNAREKPNPAKVFRRWPRADNDMREPRPGVRRKRPLGISFLASGDFWLVFEANKIQIGKNWGYVALFHRRAARATRILPLFTSTTLYQDFATAGGIGAMPAVLRFHAHGPSFCARISCAPHRRSGTIP